MKQGFFVLSLWLSCFHLAGQITESWRRCDSLPFTGYESFGHSISDGNGGVLVAASIDGDITIVKYNAAYLLIWKTTLLKTPEIDYFGDMELSNDGFIFITWNVSSFGQGADLHVACLDITGGILWQSVWNGPWNGNDAPNALSILPGGKIAIAGQTQTGLNYSSCLLTVWSPAGALVNYFILPGDTTVSYRNDSYYDLAFTPDSQLVACGSFYNDTVSVQDAVLSAFDPNGDSLIWNVVWYDTIIPNSNNSLFYSILTDTGGIFVCGPSEGAGKSSVVRFTSSGSFTWQYNITGGTFQKMIFDTENNLYSLLQTYDFRVVSISRHGSLIWDFNYVPANNGFDQVYDLAVDESNAVYLSGFRTTGTPASRQQSVVKVGSDGLFRWERLRIGSQAGISHSANAILILQNSVWSAGCEENQLTFLDGTLTVWDTSGIQIVTVVYDDNSGHLTNLIFHEDFAGNIYVCGRAFNNELLLVKRDANGGELMRFYFQDTFNIFIETITSDDFGNIFLGGYCNNNPGAAKGRIFKISPAGILQWDSTLADSSRITIVTTDASGSLFASGYHSVSGSGTDVDLFKFSPAGNLIWARSFTGTYASAGDMPGAALIDQGYIYFTYAAYNTGTNRDLALVKLDTAGNIIWQNQWAGAGTASDNGYLIGQLRDGSLIVCGTSTTPSTAEDILLMKFDTSGAILWWNLKRANSTFTNDKPMDMVIHSDTIYLAGFENAGPSISGFYCGAIDSAGNALWEHLSYAPFTSNCKANSIDIDTISNRVGATGFSGNEIKTIFFHTNGVVSDSIITGTSNSDLGSFIAASNGSFIVGGSINYEFWTNANFEISILIKYCDGPIIETASNLVICPGDTAQLYASSGFSFYNWTPLASVNNAAINNPEAFPTTTTMYTVEAVNGSGCRSFAYQKVSVSQLPQISVSGNQTICQGDTVTALVYGLTSCFWVPSANMSDPSGLTNQIWPIASQSYTISGYNSWGCFNNAGYSIIVNPLPVVNITSFLSDTFCLGNSPVNLSGYPSSGTFSGPGVISNVFDPTVSDTGAIIIFYTFTDSIGCANVDTAEVYVSQCVGLPEFGINTWSVFPNPNSGSFVLIFHGQVPASVRLNDMHGREIYQETIVNSSTEKIMSMSLDLPAGIYLLYLSNGYNQSIEKLVITD